jgi:hypothetical protein
LNNILFDEITMGELASATDQLARRAIVVTPLDWSAAGSIYYYALMVGVSQDGALDGEKQEIEHRKRARSLLKMVGDRTTALDHRTHSKLSSLHQQLRWLRHERRDWVSDWKKDAGIRSQRAAKYFATRR